MTTTTDARRALIAAESAPLIKARHAAWSKRNDLLSEIELDRHDRDLRGWFETVAAAVPDLTMDEFLDVQREADHDYWNARIARRDARELRRHLADSEHDYRRGRR